jgi:hypothetical protein
MTPEENLQADIAEFYNDPLGFVIYAYPWGEGELEQFNAPDQWQKDFLIDLGRSITDKKFDGFNPVKATQMAISSGHGIGKSALVAWTINWIMSTRPHCKGILTANTAPQLESKSWAEVIKWTKRCITAPWFAYTSGKGSMRLYHKDYKESWRCDAITCREENSESFAGQHAANSTPFYIFDEASAIPDTIWDVAEGGLTDGEPIWLAFGNPTRNKGRFFDSFHRLKHRWTTRQIDSRNCALPNKAQIQDWLEDYGEDSDFFKIRVRGLFPSKSTNQLIDSALISQAMKTDATSKTADTNRALYDKNAPIILGVDVARFGNDSTVIVFRHGLNGQLFDPLIIRQQDTMQISAHVAKIINGTHEHCPSLKIDAVFIDGIGVGAGVVDRLKQLGYSNIFDVNSASRAHEEKRYTNKRAEMYARLKEWIKSGATLPDLPRLYQELTSIDYFFDRNNRLQIQSKDEMKGQGLGSPDIADAYALTFAEIVAPKDLSSLNNAAITGQQSYDHDYDVTYS